MNVILIILDTLRQDHVGAYGNNWIRTPNLDSFAKESVVFTRCFPESLPTIPVRRAWYTGLRTFPFHGHRSWRGDFIHAAPGWDPIPEEQDTLAEVLVAEKYRTALITDCYHYFKPMRNLHRGFEEWSWIRGQEADPFKSGPALPEERILKHLPPAILNYPKLGDYSKWILGKYLSNVSERKTEEDYFAPQVFSQASRWIWKNQDASQIFLVVDSFDPHEMWDPPAYYRRLYDPDEDGVIDVIHSIYGPYAGLLSPRELKRLQANYAGKVTMVDRWLGHFLETLRLTGRMDDSLVVIMSDHGHNLGREPGDKGLITKQGQPMTHAVANLVLMMRHPQGEGAGTVCNSLCYNFDVTKTISSLLGVEFPQAEGLTCGPGSQLRTRVAVMSPLPMGLSSRSLPISGGTMPAFGAIRPSCTGSVRTLAWSTILHLNTRMSVSSCVHRQSRMPAAKSRKSSIPLPGCRAVRHSSAT